MTRFSTRSKRVRPIAPPVLDRFAGRGREVVWKTVFQNVLNENYQEITGFSSPRLSALTGFEVRY